MFALLVSRSLLLFIRCQFPWEYQRSNRAQNTSSIFSFHPQSVVSFHFHLLSVAITSAVEHTHTTQLILCGVLTFCCVASFINRMVYFASAVCCGNPIFHILFTSFSAQLQELTRTRMLMFTFAAVALLFLFHLFFPSKYDMYYIILYLHHILYFVYWIAFRLKFRVLFFIRLVDIFFWSRSDIGEQWLLCACVCVRFHIHYVPFSVWFVCVHAFTWQNR